MHTATTNFILAMANSPTVNTAGAGTRHAGYDNCKYVFICYVVLWHLLNNWLMEESIRDWPPTLSWAFQRYAQWYEKFSMPGFAFLSGFFSKGFMPGSPNMQRRWKGSVSVLLIGPVVYQVIEIFGQTIVTYLVEGRWTFRTRILYWDHVHTWYSIALLIWRAVTPVFMTFKHPLMLSLFIAFLHTHVDLALPANTRMRLFHFFPYYVGGLICDESMLNVPKPNIVGWVGIALAIGISISLPDEYQVNIYFIQNLDLANTAVFFLQYVFCSIGFLSILIMVKRVEKPIFPWSHKDSTLAIYMWHWHIVGLITGGLCPFTEINCFDYPTPIVRMMRSLPPIVAIIELHCLAIALCILLGSNWAWMVLRAVTVPNIDWLMDSERTGPDQTERSGNVGVTDDTRHSTKSVGMVKNLHTSSNANPALV